MFWDGEQIFSVEGSNLLDIKSASISYGSGLQIARGAMEFGATSTQALRIAIKNDCYTSFLYMNTILEQENKG